MKELFLSSCIAVTLIAADGCKSIGPPAMRAGRIEYNKALAESTSEQLLLNIVKMRFLDQPVFLRVSSLTSNISFQSELGTNTTGVFDSTKFPTSVSPSFTWKENPTITYQELTGADYVKQLLAPIPADTIVLLLQSWPADMVLPLAVNEINNVNNTRDPINHNVYDSEDNSHQLFSEIAQTMTKLGMQRTLEWSVTRPSLSEGTLETAILLNKPDNAQTKVMVQSLLEDLGLKQAEHGSTRLKVEYGLEKKDDSTIVLGTRSMQDVLAYSSLDVDIPESMQSTSIQPAIDWQDRIGTRLFHVKQSLSKPTNAAVAIEYDDHWFYIANDDLQSKATFFLIQVLMGMQSGSSNSGSPVLTIPVSG